MGNLKKALYQYLKKSDYPEVKYSDIQQGYNKNNFEVFNREYNVFTETEREKAVKKDIKETIWAFNADFILDHTGIERNKQVEKAFQEIQNNMCESCNELFLAMIKNFNKFYQDAVRADGYGLFLSSYDGNENEIVLTGKSKKYGQINKYYYIYRQN